MENKTYDNDLGRDFGDFERQLAAMQAPSLNDIREFIATVILASAHDNSLVDAAFEWVASRNKQN